MTLQFAIFDGGGTRIQLTEKLGTGGEGSVFAVATHERERVAKIYHQPLTADKHAKLASMVGCCDDALQAIAAWPTALLHADRGGPVCGFLMPRIGEHQAIHTVYGPAQRKARYPTADWTFLLQLARNVAAAFDTIHAHGHVIGDVNQGNVLVSRNALARLIDCDSFQITANAVRFACDVGVAHFTPPELQQARSFRGLQRTPQHDNFGLAVLIFHLLFMGRHPFAGVYSGRGEMPIERAIQELRYAFGPDASSMRMLRPPGSVGPEIATPEIGRLFQQAFCNGSDQAQRPSARSWVQELEALKREVRVCANESMHRYYGELSACPWCDLEQRDGLVFFETAIALTVTPAAVNFDLSAAWRRIETSMPPLQALPIDLASIVVTQPAARRLTAGVVLGIVLRILVGAAAVWLTVRVPRAFYFWAGIAFWVWRASARFDPMDKERARRKAELRVAEARWRETEQQWLIVSGERELNTKMAALVKERREYEQLRSTQQAAKRVLEVNGRKRQLQRFLEQFYIDAATIPGIDAGQKATLASFGIETAADVERSRMAKLRWFGAAPTSELLGWRRRLEGGFRFDAARAIEPADLEALERKFARRRNELAAVIAAGPQELKRIVARHEPQRRAFVAIAQEVARALMQARADAK